jgi:hypothetical protein
MNSFANVNNKMGCLVGWSLSKISIPQLQADIFAEQFDLKKDFGFPRLRISSGYRRAIRSISAKGEHDAKEYVPIRIRDDKEFVSHALVSPELVNSDGTFNTDVNFNASLKVGFNKQGLTFEEQMISSDPEHPLIKEIYEKTKRNAANFSANDIRTAFQRAFSKWNALRILPNGGLWWIPEQFSHKVQAWKNFLNAVSSDSTVIIIPTFNNKETVESLKTAATTSINSKLDTIKLEIKNFSESTRESTLDKKIESLKELKKRAAFYQSVLNLQIDNIEKSVNEVEEEVYSSLKQEFS